MTTVYTRHADLRLTAVDDEGVVLHLGSLRYFTVNETGLTILLIEHVMRAVMALAERVLVLHHGAAIAEGRPDAVVREPAVVESYLGAEAVD